LISHEHKVIFIHIPKTGGQSVEQMFVDDLGLTWAERGPHLTLSPNDDPALGPERLAHLYAEEYVSKGYVTQKQWDSYLTFAVVRNPYERIVSEYFYRSKIYPAWQFWRRSGKQFWRYAGPEKFLAQADNDDFTDGARHVVPQARYVCDSQGKVIVDHIIYFEEMRPKVEALLKDVLKTPRGMPYRNKTKSGTTWQKKRVHKTYRPWIAERHAEDFDLFGYAR
jgi:hypothetical protein